MRDKINIYDIPISHITREYLAYIEIMKELQLEVAGEFFVMAATLMRIKAQMLLPRRSSQEEEIEDPRDELVRNLLEYKKYKEASKDLAEREEIRRQVFTRPPIKSPDGNGDGRSIEITLFDLIGAFRKVMEDLKKQVTYRIERETYTLEEKIAAIRGILEKRSEILFTELFHGAFDRIEVIVTFLAILELIRQGALVARQMSSGPDIWIFRPDSDPGNRSMKRQYNVEERI